VPSRSRPSRRKVSKLDREEHEHKAARARWDASFRYPFGLLTIIDLIGTRNKGKDGPE
jgi:hypothetical protein